MAEDDIPDFDLDGILDWIYVEDDFPLADELAETQIPDPGYAGTKYELDMEDQDDFDLFDYWDDLHYGDDCYWEYGGIGTQFGQKRKRVASNTWMIDGKRRKLGLLDTGGDNVRFVNWTARVQILNKKPPLLQKRASFSLLPDWKKRFANVDGIAVKTEMPAAMRMAAEGKHEDAQREGPRFHSASALAEEDEFDDDEEDGEQDAEDLQAELASLDPEMLKSILRQRLGDAGLEGMDENAFMHAIGKMLSGDEGADGVADDLANSLLERATQGNDAALSGWLEGQGVSLDPAGADEDDGSSVATPELRETSDVPNEKTSVKDSPSDSAIELTRAGGGSSTEMAIHPPSPTAGAKKRAAPPAADDDGLEVRKRKKVSFDVPPSSELSSNSQQNGVEELQAEQVEKLHQPTSEDPLLAEPTFLNENAHVAETKAANSIPAEDDETITVSATKSSSKSKEPAHDTSEAASKAVDTGSEGDEIVVAPAPAKNTRKRKAEAEKSGPKKQARKVSGPAEAAQKRTRSTRAAARAGK